MKFNHQTALQTAEQERRYNAPMTSNDDFSLLKQEPSRQRGYDIRYQKDGETWMRNQAHCWMTTGDTLPAEWLAIVKDPATVAACMFPSTQRSWQAQKRRHVAEYTRETVLA